MNNIPSGIEQRLLEDYQNGHLNQDVLLRAIQAIARHEVNKALWGFAIANVALLGVAVGWLGRSVEDSTQPQPSANFEPLEVHSPYLIDNSPPGSWDFTLARGENTRVEIPAPCNGTVRKVYFQGRDGGLDSGSGAGNIVELLCDGQSYGWLMGHLHEQMVEEGQTVRRGQAIGVQGSTGRSSGDHVHAQIHWAEDWERISDRSYTVGLVESYFEFVRAGNGADTQAVGAASE